MKKIMMLGGNYFQVTAIKAAKALGYHVISVDYLPDNPGHKFSDEYYNISTVDKEAVLALAKEINIDGIVSYASDVSAPTAAYVATKLNLPTNPPDAVDILTDKVKFRKFLRENGFNVPQGKAFTSYEKAYSYCKTAPMPVIVKPTDSSGSKGVHKIADVSQLKSAWDDAMKYSRNKRIFIEEYLEKKGYEIDSDSFLVDGKIAYFGVMDQHNDYLCNPFVPVGLSAPSLLSKDKREYARGELQRMMELLHMKTGALNVEFIYDSSGKLYFLEVGPRNGGNLITDTIKLGSDVDLAKYTVLAAVGESCDDLREKEFHTNVSSYIVHAKESGTYRGLWISDDIRDDILRLDVFVKPGERVEYYDNAGYGVGGGIIKYTDVITMNRMMDNMDDYIRVNIEHD